MLSDIFTHAGIDAFAMLPVKLCRPGNRRLFESLPPHCTAVFVLFPYMCRDKNDCLAAFAGVPDYHAFARELFSRAEEYIKSKYPDCFARGYSDHSPLDERHGAATAGLGIIGRHGLLISERHSSFICIGELICDLPPEKLIDEGIPYHPGEIKHCINCGKCAAACPRQCVDEKKERCISAINQKKGILTEEETEALKKAGYAWGCDICQNACPYTEKAREQGTLYTSIPFFTRNVLTGSAEEIYALSDEDYSTYTFSYRKRAVMERNLKIICDGKTKSGI